jgi:flagellar biosynthesis/type III secretory pathway protein FliH
VSTLPRVRIVRGTGAMSDGQAPAPLRREADAWTCSPRRVAREELHARLSSDRILDEARSEATAIVEAARNEGARAADVLIREATARAEAAVSARLLALREAEGARLERDRARLIAVAVLLAERLLGAALELDPTRVAGLARTAIAEARGARRIVVDAHPLDVGVLRTQLASSGIGVQSVEVREDPALARGDLRITTDVGAIDAKLSPRLERLAAALHDALP